MTRNRNDGIRKVCGCPRDKWPKCPHGWRMNFKWKGVHHRYALDRLLAPRQVRSKTEAENEAERIRTEIREDRFREPGAAADDRPVLSTLTLTELLDTFERRYLKPERAGSSLRNAKYEIAAIQRTVVTLPTGMARPLGDWFVSDVTTDTIEQFRAARREAGIVATNRNLALLRACFNWAIRVGYIERTPFKRGTETVVKLSRELPRRRRLEPGEAERLLNACGHHLRALVEAALETGCRKGELLCLQWHQVRSEPRPELVLPAQKTKTKRDRRIPISTRLRSILAMRRTGPDGEPHPPTAYVFGNEVGQPIKRFTRAWEAAVLRSHGHTPEYTDKGTKGLTAACRAQLRAINLHFHDLRREAGSRWLDGGVPLQVIRDWLGHANISQTSTYLESTFAGQHEVMRAFEERRGVQQSATPSETGGRKVPLDDMDANRNAQETTEKHH
jgi:integrase